MKICTQKFLKQKCLKERVKSSQVSFFHSLSEEQMKLQQNDVEKNRLVEKECVLVEKRLEVSTVEKHSKKGSEKNRSFIGSCF